MPAGAEVYVVFTSWLQINAIIYTKKPNLKDCMQTVAMYKVGMVC